MRMLPRVATFPVQSVRHRLLLLLVALLVVFVGALAALALHQRRQGGVLLASREEELGQLFRRLIQLNSVPLETFVHDYSSSDAMVEFVDSGDSLWAAVNIDPPLRTFRVHSVWVYRNDFTLVYYGALREAFSMWEIPALKSNGADLFAGQRMAHFFTYGPGGLWEVCGAPIRLRASAADTVGGNGYLVAAVCLDRRALNELSTLLGGTVSDVPNGAPDGPPVRPDSSTLTLRWRLPAWDGSALAQLEARVPVPAVAHLRRSSGYQVILGAALAAVLLALLAWALRAWVSLPLRVVATSLDKGDPGCLGELELRADEFGHVARLVRRFHAQHAELLRENVQRTDAEADLTQRLRAEQMMAAISTGFVSQAADQFDAEFGSALRRLGEFLDTDRCYVFQFTPDLAVLSCTHEWCREGVAGVMSRLQGIVATTFPWNTPLHRSGAVVNVPDVSGLPPEAASWRAELEAESVRSLLCVPMACGGTVLGFVGVDSVRRARRWSESAVSLLRLAGEIFANALQHQRSGLRRRELETQLGHARQIEALGRLAGGVAHDLNNLLVPVLGYADIIRDELSADHPSRADVAQIRRAAEQARGLTQQLLAFARRQVLNVQVIDLAEEVGLFQGFLRRLIPESIEIVCHAEPAGGSICADPTQVRQIIANLAINARDAMPQGGTITLTIAAAELDERAAAAHLGAAPGHYVTLAVRDTGTGMDEATQRHLFEPFFTTKEAGKGTGLGLATVHGIVTQHGGHIEVTSAPGCGTTVTVYLPRAVTPAAAAVPAGSAAAAVVPEPRALTTVLVVEDAEDVRAFVCRVLPPRGFRVLSAPTPAAAVRLAQDTPESIGILLTDVVMPGLNGRELYRRLQEARPGLRVLYMSGYPADVIASQGVLDPGVHFVPKPFDLETLVAALREALAA
jgi:signal transduction histidine kinase/HAMP domain-containing protein